MADLVPTPLTSTFLNAAQFRRLAEVPPELEWFADIQNSNTRAAYRQDLGQFMRFAGIIRPEQFREVVRAHVIAWRKDLEARGLSPATIRRKLAALASLYDYLCEKNAVPGNPIDGVSRPREGANEGKTPALSDDQARALLHAPQGGSWQAKRDRAMLAVLLYHGLRASELCVLTIADYTDRRGIRTLSVYGKGAKLRYIPVHPQAVAALADYLEASPHATEARSRLFISAARGAAGPRGMIRQRVRELIERYAACAGIPLGAVRPHSLRATAATNALDHGADIAKVQDWLGHANPATTRLYDKRADRPADCPTFRVIY